jgi:pimeloyl-ACP methyl ester carboxylesterase
MSKVSSNGIQIEYETFGAPSSRPLLLIIGFGNQMIQWDNDLCQDLAARGHYVIRFDNRDVGLSSKLDQTSVPNITETMGKIMHGEHVTPPYTLEDMADDAIGLLDALKIAKAHICGMSMGGMIAQTVAIRHHSRLLSLISIYSTTGNPKLPQPKPEIMKLLMTRAPKDRETNIEHMLGVFRTLAGPGFPFDVEWTRKVMGECFDRSFYPQGLARQLVAILAQKDRRHALASVKAPTLVIHGTDDPLVPVEGGKDTAKAIPGSQLMLIEGMGHDLPHGGAWPRIVEAITVHTLKAGH